MTICGKCGNKFIGLYAGMDGDYIKFLKLFVDFACREGYTDTNCKCSMNRWLNRLEKRLKLKDNLRNKLKEFIKEIE